MTTDYNVECVTAGIVSSALGRDTKCEKIDPVGERSQDSVTSNYIRGNDHDDIKVLVIVAYGMEMKVTSARIDRVKSKYQQPRKQ